MKGTAGRERGKTIHQLALFDDELAGAEGFGRAEVIPLYDEAEEPRPARGVRRAGRLLVACGLGLLPWLYVLATGLPATATAAQAAAPDARPARLRLGRPDSGRPRLRAGPGPPVAR